MTSIPVEILLVEDNLNDIKLTLHALKENRLTNEIRVARDGAEALQLLHGSGTDSCCPKLILLDLKLPLVDGIEVLREIKSDERTRSIPVVVLTSSREEPDIQKCYELGVNSYIVKPVDFDQFTQAVRDIGLYWLLLNQRAE